MSKDDGGFRKFDIRSRHTEINLVNNSIMLTVIVACNAQGCEFDCTLTNLLDGEELCFFNMRLVENTFQIFESNGQDLYKGQEIIEYYRHDLIAEMNYQALRIENPQ